MSYQPLTTIPEPENAEVQAKPHGLPDSTADHPLPPGGPQPGSYDPSGSPAVVLPVG